MDLQAGDVWLGSEQCFGVDRSGQIWKAGVGVRITGFILHGEAGLGRMG